MGTVLFGALLGDLRGMRTDVLVVDIVWLQCKKGFLSRVYRFLYSTVPWEKWVTRSPLNPFFCYLS